MQTQAYFDDIQLQILRELKRATSSIHIAVAWFTDPEIFAALCERARAGVRVELVIFNDAINRKSGIEYELLNALGGLFLLVGDKKRNSTVMHNKFCVIDATAVITGSYNWSRQAQANDENVTVITDHPELASQFLAEFEAILERNAGKGAGVGDHGKILQRLEALRHVLPLEDDDDIELQVAKLRKLLPADSDDFVEITKILVLIDGGDFDTAVTRIADYIQRRKQVTVYADPEIPELKLELKALELQIGSLENEKADLEKLLFSFHHRHTVELGELIRKILQLREQVLAAVAEEDETKQEEYEEARRDSAEYEEDYQETIQQEIIVLNAAEQEEIKAIFRAALKMCHPDVVAPEFREEATRLCAQLNEANSRNNVTRVKAIYENLMQGIFKPLSDTVGDAQRLLREVVKHRSKVKDLARELFTLRTSETYLKVKEIANWDAYFAKLHEQLQEELLVLEERARAL